MADHRPPPRGRGILAGLVIWLAIVACTVTVVLLFRSVMHEPVGSGVVPGRGVHTIAPPGPSGGVQ